MTHLVREYYFYISSSKYNYIPQQIWISLGSLKHCWSCLQEPKAVTVRICVNKCQ